MRSSLPLCTLLLTSACMTAPPPPPVPPELVAAETAAETAKEASIAYPLTRRMDLVEPQFGVNVADPYRWLENDVRNDPEVRAWVTAENAVTDKFLETLPLRDTFKARMTELYDYERFGIPEKKGGRYFYTRNDGLQNQSVLFVRDRVDGEGRMLIDPNTWSKDGATALAEWVPSEDGKHLLYSIQDGGTDWRTVRVLDVATAQPVADEVKWVKFSALEWAKDGSGFYYSRFPEPKEGQTFQQLNENQSIYFHKLGTAQSADRLVFSTLRRQSRADLHLRHQRGCAAAEGRDAGCQQGKPETGDDHRRGPGDAGRRIDGRREADRVLPGRCENRGASPWPRRQAALQGEPAGHRHGSRLRRRAWRQGNLLLLHQLQPADDHLSL